MSLKEAFLGARSGISAISKRVTILLPKRPFFPLHWILLFVNSVTGAVEHLGLWNRLGPDPGGPSYRSAPPTDEGPPRRAAMK